MKNINEAIEAINATELADGTYIYRDDATGSHWIVDRKDMELAQARIESGEWDYSLWCADTSAQEVQAVYTVNNKGVKKVERQIAELTDWGGDFTEIYDVLEARRRAGESIEYEVPPSDQNESTRVKYQGYCAFISLEESDFNVEYIEA